MTIWRLVTHHQCPEKMLETYIEKHLIALGWGKVGDLSLLYPTGSDTIQNAILHAYDGSLPLLGALGAIAGGRCLWGFYNEMRIGDLVILGIGNGPLSYVVEVVGDYEFINPPVDGDDYNHCRRVRLDTNQDGKELWSRHTRADRWNRRWPLIRLVEKGQSLVLS